MTNTYLTNGGNVLAHWIDKDEFAFVKISGEFIRQVSTEEGKYLASTCQKIAQIPPIKAWWLVPSELPTWHLLWKTEDADQSNHIGHLSCNGGSYGTYITSEYYAAKMPNGEWKFRILTRISNRNNFSQDDFGNYESNLCYIHVQNAKGNVIFCVKGSENYSDVMERVSSETTLEAALRDAGRYTSPMSDGNGESDDRSAEERTTIYNTTFTQLKERAVRLKDVGVVRQKKNTNHRNLWRKRAS